MRNIHLTCSPKHDILPIHPRSFLQNAYNLFYLVRGYGNKGERIIDSDDWGGEIVANHNTFEYIFTHHFFQPIHERLKPSTQRQANFIQDFSRVCLLPSGYMGIAMRYDQFCLVLYIDLTLTVDYLRRVTVLTERDAGRMALSVESVLANRHGISFLKSPISGKKPFGMHGNSLVAYDISNRHLSLMSLNTGEVTQTQIKNATLGELTNILIAARWMAVTPTDDL